MDAPGRKESRDADDGFLAGRRFLLLDCDPLYTTAFRELLRSARVTPIRLPPSSPTLNAYAERFVQSITGECLSKLVLLDENHLRTFVREYVAHYHTERNHQGLDGRLIEPPANTAGAGQLVCRERIGGLLRFTTDRRPEHVASGFGPNVCPGRLGPLIRSYHQQAP